MPFNSQRLLKPLDQINTPKLLSWLSMAGEMLRRHRMTVIALQWVIVVIYLGLLVVPAFRPLPPSDARILHNLTLFARFLFWGIWWPFTILSMMLMGRLWCGVLCPEGTICEFVSRFGRGRPIPRWIKWGGWPFVTFLTITVYGQLISVYKYAASSLLILGGSTISAMAVSLMYGRGKRVWCRYLCPVTGVFALLARVAPIYFKVDHEAWAASNVAPQPINCPPMVHIKSMTGAAECHICGQCSGHKNAIYLSARMPGIEIINLAPDGARPWEARLLVFGMIGIAIGAFQWRNSPWFGIIKQSIADWLVAYKWLWAFDTNAPWWLLTHYPETSATFSWLDGSAIIVYIVATALVVGGWVWNWLSLAGILLGRDSHYDTYRLAYCLVPLGGFGLFLGLSDLTISMLALEGIRFTWMGWVKGLFLTLGTIWSLALAWGVLYRIGASYGRTILSWCSVGVAIAGIIIFWCLQL